MRRRSFLKSSASVASLAACALPRALPAAAQRQGPPFFGGQRYRAIRGRLHAVSTGDERLGDYVVFGDSAAAHAPADLFICTTAPEGIDERTVLEPLGRHADTRTAHRIACRHAARSAATAHR